MRYAYTKLLLIKLVLYHGFFFAGNQHSNSGVSRENNNALFLPLIPQFTKKDSRLLSAVHSGFVYKINDALKNGAHLDAQNENRESALMIASRLDYGNVVQCLLKRKAAIDMVDKNKETSLAIATRCGNSAIVKMLLSEGAQCNTQNRHDHTP